MAYEGGYLQYDRNLVISTQGSKCIHCVICYSQLLGYVE